MSAVRRLFSEGFRVFFLGAGVFAVVAMGIWWAFVARQALGQTPGLPTDAAPHLWHAHEMIFGYGAAAMGGFFLTAVPNWTGARAAPHLFIGAVAGLWLAGRLAVFWSASLPPALVAVADLAFVPVLAAKMLTQLMRRPKPQQMIFLVLLALFWTGNLMVHLEWAGLTDDTLWAGLRVGLLTLATMIVVLGGRVTPGFTRNAMVQAGRDKGLPENPVPLAVVAIAAALALPLGHILTLPEAVLGPVAVLAGAAALGRVVLWRGLWTRGRPILWSLHLSYALNAAGLVAYGLAGLGIGSEVAALHLLGIGGVGGMTLAVMSRATLGHTGRPLVAPGAVALAYALVPVAALVRFAGSALPSLHTGAILTAGALWIGAFALFTGALWPAFRGPRLPRSGQEPPA